MNVAAGIRRAPKARAAFVTPSHPISLGSTMSASRRIQLLNLGPQRRGWVVEDDYDSEFRYESLPIASMHGLDIKRARHLHRHLQQGPVSVAAPGVHRYPSGPCRPLRRCGVMPWISSRPYLHQEVWPTSSSKATSPGTSARCARSTRKDDLCSSIRWRANSPSIAALKCMEWRPACISPSRSRTALTTARSPLAPRARVFGSGLFRRLI